MEHKRESGNDLYRNTIVWGSSEFTRLEHSRTFACFLTCFVSYTHHAACSMRHCSPVCNFSSRGLGPWARDHAPSGSTTSPPVLRGVWPLIPMDLYSVGSSYNAWLGLKNTLNRKGNVGIHMQNRVMKNTQVSYVLSCVDYRVGFGVFNMRWDREFDEDGLLEHLQKPKSLS